MINLHIKFQDDILSFTNYKNMDNLWCLWRSVCIKTWHYINACRPIYSLSSAVLHDSLLLCYCTHVVMSIMNKAVFILFIISKIQKITDFSYPMCIG